MAAGGIGDIPHSQRFESSRVQSLRQHVFFLRKLPQKRNRVPLPDTLAHGTFHTLLAIRQCGADTELFVDIVTIIVDIPGSAVHKRRFIIIVAGRAEPPCNPVPAVWNGQRSDGLPFRVRSAEKPFGFPLQPFSTHNHSHTTSGYYPLLFPFSFSYAITSFFGAWVSTKEPITFFCSL